MDNINSERTPDFLSVVPYFFIAALSFLIFSIGMTFDVSIFQGHFYQHRILAYTHLLVLGWITMIIMGALYQMIPVIFEVNLFSNRIAKYNIIPYSISLIIMIYTFAKGNFGLLLALSSTLLLISILLFIYNALKSISITKNINYSGKFIRSALYWLTSTIIIGFLMAINHRLELFNPQFPNYLKVHAHLGIIGWFLQLIIGVSSVLFPMFLVAHDLDESKLKKSFYAINIALMILLTNWIIAINIIVLNLIAVVIMIIGIGFYLLYLRDAYKNRLRKLDVGMQMSTMSLINLMIPIIVVLTILIGSIFIKIDASYSNLYGYALFIGFITPMILGQTYKTLPFIIWLHHYQKYVGKKKVMMPADLYNNNIAHSHIWTYGLSILLWIVGFLLGSNKLLILGNSLLILTSALYFVNIFKLVFHKPSESFMEDIILKPTEDIFDLLKVVIDPEVEVNIVDLGLVYKVDIEDTDINVTMTLSTPACPIGDSIMMNVMEIVQVAFPDHQVNVHLTFEPKWNPSMITEAGLLALGDDNKWSKEK